MEKYIEYLENSISILKTADHMTYMTYPLIKEKRLLLKILNQLNTALMNILNSILQYEYLYKRIQLYKDPKENFRTFKEKCASRYNITEEEMNVISKVFTLTQKHKNSPLEFVKKDKIVIMTDNLHTETIDLPDIKEFLIKTKQILKKAENKIRRKI